MVALTASQILGLPETQETHLNTGIKISVHLENIAVIFHTCRWPPKWNIIGRNMGTGIPTHYTNTCSGTQS